MKGARPLTDDEIKALLKYGFNGRHYKRDRALFALGISTGKRISELLSVRVKDITHFRQGTDELLINDYVYFRKQAMKGEKSGEQKKLFRFAKHYILDWIKAMQNKNSWDKKESRSWPLFISERLHQDGQRQAIHYTQAIRLINDAYSNAEISGHVTTHSMRKTYAKKKYDDALKKFKKGESTIEPLRAVQEALGHVVIDNTIRYLSFLSEEIDETAFSFEVE